MYALILELMGRGMRWEFANRDIRIGRDPNCDLVLPSGEFPMVSRSHLLIRLAAERYWVEDLNTPGGTFVNGAQVQVSPLSDGDVLRLGVDGPELRASIVASYRLEGSEGPPRRQSASEEASTWIQRGESIRASQEAPTVERVSFAAGPAEKAPPEAAPDEKPRAEGRPPAVAPKVPGNETKPLIVSAEPGPNQAASALAPAGLTAEPVKPEAAPRDAGPAKTTAAASAIGTPGPPADAKPATTGTTAMELKLKTIRNLLIAALLLIVALWVVVLYHMRR